MDNTGHDDTCWIPSGNFEATQQNEDVLRLDSSQNFPRLRAMPYFASGIVDKDVSSDGEDTVDMT
jgi:hypothetical protein